MQDGVPREHRTDFVANQLVANAGVRRAVSLPTNLLLGRSRRGRMATPALSGSAGRAPRSGTDVINKSKRATKPVRSEVRAATGRWWRQ